MVICRNADPFLDGFGIILTMQIPSRLHVIEASKAFSKIAFVKELPVCSSIQRKNTLLNKSTRPLYVPAMARRLPKPLKEKLLKCDGKLIKFYVLTIIPKDTQNKAETDKHIQARFPSICSGFMYDSGYGSSSCRVCRMLPGHTECSPSTQNCSPGAQNCSLGTQNAPWPHRTAPLQDAGQLRSQK